MAKQKGFYNEAGLDVTIKQANPMKPDTFAPVVKHNLELGTLVFYSNV